MNNFQLQKNKQTYPEWKQYETEPNSTKSNIWVRFQFYTILPKKPWAQITHILPGEESNGTEIFQDILVSEFWGFRVVLIENSENSGSFSLPPNQLGFLANVMLSWYI